MATTRKKKAPKKTATKKAAAKKQAARKPRRRPAKPKGPSTTVQTHPFAPQTTVSFLPVHVVTVERDMNRAPFSKAIKTAKVDKQGVLQVSGLEPGPWCAAGPINAAGDEWRYIQFTVK